MPTTSATIVKTVSAGSIVPDFYGNAGNVANAGTDKVEWDGNYATPLTVRAEALWLSGLLKKIEPSVPDRPAIRVLELKFTANTALTRKFGNGANPNIKTHLDGALIDATHKTTQAVPFEMYNLWKMTAKEMMTNATPGGASGTDYSYGASNPRTQVWPRLLFTKFTFKLYNNIAGMPTSGMVVGSTLMAELIEAEADYTTATTNSTAPGAGAEVYVAWETVGREYDTKIHTTSV
eukprot:tig00000601_g2287.t1